MPRGINSISPNSYREGRRSRARMAYFGITATEAGLAPRPARRGGRGRRSPPPRRGLAERRPVVVLVHGYKFDPGAPRRPTRTARSIAFQPARGAASVRSWPTGLGFADDGGETGLARRLRLAGVRAAPRRASLAQRAHRFRARSTTAPARYGARLAELVALIQRLAPGRPVDLLAHSLGARVALAALPHLAAAPGRVILLGAAEFDARAREALDALVSPSRPQDLQRDGAGERPLRLRLRDLRAAPRPGGAGDRPRPRRPRCPTGSTCSSTGRGDRLGQRARHPAEAAATRGSATGASTPAPARSRSTRRSCGAGRAGTSPALRAVPGLARAGAALEPAAARARPVAAGGRPGRLRVATRRASAAARRAAAGTLDPRRGEEPGERAAAPATQRPTTAQSGTVTTRSRNSSPGKCGARQFHHQLHVEDGDLVRDVDVERRAADVAQRRGEDLEVRDVAGQQQDSPRSRSARSAG